MCERVQHHNKEAQYKRARTHVWKRLREAPRATERAPTLQRCEKDWCADLQSLQINILNFMQTSLNPMRSSCVQVAQRLLSGRRRSWLRYFMWSCFKQQKCEDSSISAWAESAAFHMACSPQT